MLAINNSKLAISLITLSAIIVFTSAESVIKSAPTCALLYKDKNFGGEKYLIQDESQVSNFEEEHISSSDVWNSTLSFSVEKGCLLTACNDTYFNGLCREFPEPVIELPTGFDTVLSANCTCQKECKCSDIHMKSTSCARAYFGKGCNVCNPYYADLKGSVEAFPEEYSSKITAMKVRDGCILNIYDEEKFDSEAIPVEGTIEDWSGDPIGSYTCECSPDSFKPKVKPLRPTTYPPLIDIPVTIDAVSSMMQGDLARHPGLLAAIKSLRNKRSSKNVYIMALGSTGAGKSSAINLLFDNPNVTRVGEANSTTSDIHEFRIPIPVDELGIANSELRVIDTPGLGDTRGLEQDAKFLATLDDYLTNHEELHNRIPNIVLIFHKFYDNRFSGEGSSFVKMLRGLDTFRKRITDNNYSNVIFVFSHFCSETNSNKKKPNTRLSQFKSVVQDFTQFPKPIVLTVAENKAAEHALSMVNGYFKLPNGDYYPRNLFEKIQLATLGGGDPIGDAVIRTGFRDSDEFNISSITYRLVNSNYNKVPYYLDILINAIIEVENTEVSQQLRKSFESMNSTLKKTYPISLNYLQKALNIRNIKTISDVPKTTLEILTLLSSLKQNEAIMYLLENALKIKPPVFQQNVVTGHSYNVFKDTPLSSSPYKLGDLINSDIGFLFPSVMTSSIVNQVSDFFQIKDDRADYVKERLTGLGIQGNIPQNKFTGATKPGFNIKSESFQPNSCRITAVREVRKFDLSLNDRPQLNERFKKVLEQLPPFNETDHENVKVWNEFFDTYGTHVVKHVYGGGAIEIELESNKACDTNVFKALFELIQFAEDLTVLRNDSKVALAGEGIQHRLKFKGGDQAYHTADLTKMTLDDASSLLSNWKDSLRLNPTILTTEMQLLPLSEVAKKVGQKQNISSEIQRVTSILFNSSLTYIPPKKIKEMLPGPDRDNTPLAGGSQGAFTALIETLIQQSSESNKRFDILMTQIREDQKAAAERREKAREDQLAWERRQEEIRIANAKLEAEERARRDEQQQQAMNKYLEDQKAAEKERREIEERNQRNLISMQEAQAKQMAEMMKAMANRPVVVQGGGGGSCLQKGTLILLSNGKQTPVEKLQPGDTILDHELNPTKVLGISSEFILDQTFYGFDNKSFFFTDSHMLVGPKNGQPESLQFYVQDRIRLIDQNPLMEFTQVKEMSTPDDFNILKFDPITSNVVPDLVKVYKDPVSHPVDTMVYFIQVDNPAGTYIANGYVCRHEIPPLQFWPNTMAVLFSLHSNPDFMSFEKVPYTLTSLPVIHEVVAEVQSKVEQILNSVTVKDLNAEDKQILFNNENAELVVGSIFNHPSFSVFGMGLYSKVGKVMAGYLDDFEANDLSLNSYFGSLQHLLLETISKEISKSVQSKMSLLFPTEPVLQS